MIFFPRELSDKLQAKGCKSESGLYWVKLSDRRWSIPCAGSKDLIQVPCFYQNDFTGCHEQARGNSMLVWPGLICRICEQPYYSDRMCRGDYYCDRMDAYESHRHAMIDAPDAAKYLEETMR